MKQRNHFYEFNLYLLPSVLQGVLGVFLVVPITTFFLDPEDFGIVALMSALVSPLGPLSSSGAGWVLGAHYLQSKSLARKALLFNVVFLDFFLKSVWVVAFYVVGLFFLDELISSYRPEYQLYFGLTLLNAWLGVFWPTVSQVLIFQNKAIHHFALELARWVVRVVVTLVCLAWYHMGVLALLVGPVIANGVLCLFESMFLVFNARAKIRLTWIKETIRVGFPSIPADVAETVSKMADRYLLQLWQGNAVLGIYSHSQAYLNLFNFFNKSFSRTIATDATTAIKENDTAKLAEIKFKVVFVLWTLLVAGIGIIFFSRDMISFLTHGKFVEAAILVVVGYYGIMSVAFGTLYTRFLIAQKQSQTLMFSMVIPSLVTVLLVALGVQLAGMYGAAAAMALYQITTQVWRSICAKRLGFLVSVGKQFAVVTGIYWIILAGSLILSLPFLVRLFIFLGVIVAFGGFWFRWKRDKVSGGESKFEVS